MKHLRIVLADDESLIRMDLREMLLDAGHEVVGEASDGKEAVALVRKLKPDCVIMDVKMPVMDGLEAAAIIGKEELAPVLLLTAYSQKDIVAKAKAAGVIGYLVKPIREEQLFPEMEIAVSRFAEFKQLNSDLENLKDNLETRKLVERAKGILMTVHKMTEQDAYRTMQQFSMSKRISLKELAATIIANAEKRK